MVYVIGRFAFWVYYNLFFRLKITGREHIPKKDAVIFCANHTSVQDPMVLAAGVKRQVHFIAKKEIFKNRFFAFVLKALGIIPVDRENPSMSVYKRAIQLLKDGKALGLFAQGKRMTQVEAGESKAGVALFALKSGACVVPVNVMSTYKMFSEIHVAFGEPISLDGYKGQKIKTELLNEIMEQVMGKVAELGRQP